ncbi:glutamyl-tRNA(Gln) amidotransferase subunit A, mitochondrial [Phlebotomus argentipes]|uniref:glutamyl-tRNA(Gln) amidotransferase subunit A, mitochondrial n=1 Tax=Phlebotomus argentipes TaxID=94469 RepID=UPI0028933308|nr:glutamyl-tRNA(Gln) amidotransferase subunit A, mitochondrial [Phlebotomus argentipes]
MKVLPRSIKLLAAQLREKSVNCEEISTVISSTVQKTKNLNAFITVTEECAEKQWSDSKERHKLGKSLGDLDGVPIAVKDNFCTKNIRTTCASRMLRFFTPTYNATVYERLAQRGAVLVGKTNMDEFAMGSGATDSIFGPVKNPWSDGEENWRISGGSSGGSAVAVATGSCYAALGSDTGGSTRNPASYCGVVGLKPTYGLLSRHGLIPLVNSLDVPGILTRSVEDCTVVLNAIAGPDDRDSTTLKSPHKPIELPPVEKISLRGLKVGIPAEYHSPEMAENVSETWKFVARLLEEAGATVTDVSLPHTSSSIAVYSVLNTCEVASNMARYDGIEFGHRAEDASSTEKLYAESRAVGFNHVVKTRILSGNFFLLRRNYENYFMQALKVRRLIAQDFQKVFHGECHLLLTPTTLSEAPAHQEFVGHSNRDQCAVQDFCTQPVNMAGIPAISLPIRLSENNLPLSLQLIGPRLSESLLLTVARWIEHTVDFQHRVY